MKPLLALMGIVFTVCAPAVAQETSGDRIVIPARNSTRPRKLDVSLMQGSVTVKAYAGKDVIVETTRSGRNEARSTPPPGMHRIDLNGRDLVVEEEDNVITVRSRGASSSGVVISVPADTSVKVQSHNGSVEAEGVNGELDVESQNGRITLTNVSGAVVAHSLNGGIHVTMDRVDPSKPLSFSTLNGTIDVTLPGDLKANLKLNTHMGEIWSDFDIKLGAGAATRQNNTSDGKFRVTMDRNLTGTINGGGAELSFYTLNGKITIRKK